MFFAPRLLTHISRHLRTNLTIDGMYPRHSWCVPVFCTPINDLCNKWKALVYWLIVIPRQYSTHSSPCRHTISCIWFYHFWKVYKRFLQLRIAFDSARRQISTPENPRSNFINRGSPIGALPVLRQSDNRWLTVPSFTNLIIRSGTLWHGSDVNTD